MHEPGTHFISYQCSTFAQQRSCLHGKIKVADENKPEVDEFARGYEALFKSWLNSDDAWRKPSLAK